MQQFLGKTSHVTSRLLEPEKMSPMTSIYCSRTKEPNVICIPRIPPHTFTPSGGIRFIPMPEEVFYRLLLPWNGLDQPSATVDTLRECSNCSTTTYQKMIKISISHGTLKFLNIPLPLLPPSPSSTCIHPHITTITLFGQNEQMHR